MKYSHNENKLWISFIYSFNDIYGMKSTWRVLLCIEVTTIEIELGTRELWIRNNYYFPWRHQFMIIHSTFKCVSDESEQNALRLNWSSATMCGRLGAYCIVSSNDSRSTFPCQKHKIMSFDGSKIVRKVELNNLKFIIMFNSFEANHTSRSFYGAITHYHIASYRNTWNKEKLYEHSHIRRTYSWQR